MGKMLKKIDINLLSSYWRTQNRLVRKHWLINSVVWFCLWVFCLMCLYHWFIKPQTVELRFAQKQVEILQKQREEFNNTEVVPVNSESTSSAGFVTIQQQNADLRAVLQQIANSGGMSLLVSENTQGTITLFLESLPWRKALDVVLELSNLMVEERGGVLVVRTEEEVIERAKQELLLNP
jgi:p-aminobenzoyl-glutamate transporter AbgT